MIKVTRYKIRNLLERARISILYLVKYLSVRIAMIWPTSRNHLIQKYSEAPYIGTTIQGVGLPLCLLRRHVREGSGNLTARFTLLLGTDCKSEVCDLRTTVGTQQDVCRLQVSVEQPVLVGMVNSIGNLDQQVDGPFHLDWASTNFMAEVTAFHKLKHHKTAAIIQFATVEDSDDVFVFKFSCCVRLFQKTVDTLLIGVISESRDFDSNFS